MYWAPADSWRGIDSALDFFRARPGVLVFVCMCGFVLAHLRGRVPLFGGTFSFFGIRKCVCVCVCVCVFVCVCDFNCPSSMLDTAMAWY